MTRPEPISTTLLTGFLGSGKTTLLRRALADGAFQDTAVVVNEIGEIAIDHHLVDFVEGGVLELPGGCLCCAVREDLARTLRDLVDRRDSREVREFRRIAIETSGLADPAPILYTLAADPTLDMRLALSRVVTLVDALSGAETLDRFREAARQAALADILVISKTDLAPLTSELSAQLEALNPRAQRIVSSDDADPAALLFRAAPHRRPAPISAAPEAVHSHGIDAFAIVFECAPTRLDFARALGGLARQRGNDLLRVKGILAFADAPRRPAVVQASQHALHAPQWLADWPDEDHRNRLVFVVHEILRSEILDRFDFAAPRVVNN